MKANSFLQLLSDYVPGKSMDEVREQYGLCEVIKLASNENPLGPSRLGMQKAAEQISKLHLYPRGDSPDLRRALAKKHGLAPEQFIVANGSDEVIQYLSMVLLAPGDQILTSTPTFSEYKFNAIVAGAEVQLVPMTAEYQHDLDALLAAINPRTKIIYLCSPNNPTGTWIAKEQMLRFLAQVPSDVVVAVDQAYAEFALDPEYSDLFGELKNFPNLVLLRTFSKLYGLAGLRCGYAIASSELVQWMMKVKQPFNVNLLAQAAAAAALFDQEFIDETLRVNAVGMQALNAYFAQRNLRVLPSQANFIAVEIGEQAGELVAWLESKGMIIRQLKSFGMHEWVRITVGLEHENQVLMNLLDLWYGA